jgi:hypothetical protein
MNPYLERNQKSLQPETLRVKVAKNNHKVMPLNPDIMAVFGRISQHKCRNINETLLEPEKKQQ